MWWIRVVPGRYTSTQAPAQASVEVGLASCPFCNGDISETLVLHGGTCPHCFGEIPGEETPTDPGEEVKAQVLEADRRHAAKRTWGPIALAGAAVIAVVGYAGYSVVFAEPVPEPIMLEDDFLDGLTLSFDEWEEPEEENVVEGARRAPTSTKKRTGTAAQPSAAELAKRMAQVSEGSGPGGLKRPTRTGTTGGPKEIVAGNDGGMAMTTGEDGGLGSLQITTKRTAALLTEESDIKGAIRDLWRSRGARLQQCYDRRLKEDEDLRGQWNVSFTIGTDGKVMDPRVEGVTTKDDKLEACIASQAKQWAIYGRLPKPRTVTLPLRFGV
jgi:outer membrane biosynthesis protein TonB